MDIPSSHSTSASIAEILQMVRMVGALVGCADRGDKLAADLELEIDSIRAAERASRYARASTLKNGTSR